MPLDQNAIIKQIDDVLSKSDLRSRYSDFSDLPKQTASEAINLLYSVINRAAPAGSVYINNAETYKKYLLGNVGLALGPLRGILKALGADYEAGYLQSFAELVHADIFADPRHG